MNKEEETDIFDNFFIYYYNRDTYFFFLIIMKNLQSSTLQSIQDSLGHFSQNFTKHLAPAQVWELMNQKLNAFQSSDVENKFVTFSSVMNLISALIQISVGMIMKSMSVVSSAIDSLLDFVL